MNLTGAAAEPPVLTGVVTVQHANARQWRFILLAANTGIVVLFALQTLTNLGRSLAPTLILVLCLFVITNAILVPIAITQTRRRLSLDFDRGVLLARGVAYPAAELRALVAATRTFPGTAQLLSFQFPTGAVDVQVSGFTPTAESRARNAALAAFVRQWLPIPEAAEVPQRTGLSLNHSAIGKQEALAILSR